MKTLCRALISIACLGLLAGAPARAADGVEVRLTALASGKLDVSYRLPPGCDTLPLREAPMPLRVARELRAAWLAMDDCGGLEGESVTRRRASCNSVRFQVPARATMLDRVYPPVYPVGEQGLYVHTGLFAPSSDCGPVHWRLASEGGSVVLSGTARGPEVAMPQASLPALRFTAVYFSRKTIAPSGDPIVIFDPAVPGWLSASLQDASDGILPHYRKVFAQMPVPAPALVTTHVQDQGETRFQAEAADPRMVRLALYNFGAERNVEQLARARGTLAHEYAHTLQTAMRTDEFRHPERTLLLEGGAEFVRWMSEYRLGWKTGAALTMELSDAINLCLIDTGDLPWKQVMTRNSGRTPYHCGLAFHVLALAGRKSPLAAEHVLGNYYAAVRREPNLNFADGIECGDTPGCSASFLPDLFRSNAGVASQVADRLRALGLAQRSEVTPQPPTRLHYARMAFAQLMTEDCNGQSFWTRSDHFEVGAIDSCRTLEKGMKLAGVEGVSLFADPLQAAQALATACEKHGSVVLSTTDGRNLAVPCRHPYRPATTFYRIDASKLFPLLEARQL